MSHVKYPDGKRPELVESDVDWKEPEPLGRDAVAPPFPLHVLPSWVSEFVAAEAASVQVPLDMPVMFAIGALAAVVGGQARVQAWGGWSESCNLYTATAMPPSNVKSPVHRHVTAPIAEFERQLQQEVAPQIGRALTQRAIATKRHASAIDRAAKAAGGDRIAAEAEANEAQRVLDDLPVPIPPRLIVDDTTPEQLKTLLADHGGRLAMLSAESSLFGNIASQRYSKSPNLEAVLCGYSGDDMRVDRRDRSEVLLDPRLTICIAVQPHVLREAYQNEAARERGLFARFLYAMPKSNAGYRDLCSLPPEVPAHVTAAWDRNIKAIARGMRGLAEPMVISLNTEAQHAFQAWRADIEPEFRPGGKYASIEGWAGKLPGNVLRLAGLLHVARLITEASDSGEIGTPAIAAAIELAEYFTAHAMIVFDSVGDDDSTINMRKILNWIAVRGLTEFTRGNASKAFSGRMKREEMTEALNGLTDRGHLRLHKAKASGNGCRPVEQYAVNPGASHG